MDDRQRKIARYQLGGGTTDNAMILAKVYRDGGAWSMKAIGELGNGRTYDALVPLMQKYL
jgi:tellurium resistance protein TerZ